MALEGVVTSPGDGPEGGLVLLVKLRDFGVRIFLMYRELATLTEGFGATIDTTDERLLPGVRVFVLLEVLGQDKSLLAVSADVLLVIEVLHVVSLEGELAREKFLAVPNVTFVKLLPHLVFIIIMI